MPTTRLTILFERFLFKACSSAEKRELAELILSREHEETINGLLEKAWADTNGETDMTKDKVDELFDSILTSEPVVTPGIQRPLPVLRMTSRKWWAAAAILIFFATGSYFLFFNNKRNKQDEIVNAAPGKDIKAPATNRATITLVSGKTIYLDSIGNGELAVQGNIKVIKLANGQIAYQTAGGEIIKELQYNTLSNPRGSKIIDMQLADGTHVWLNAGSSVTYPVAFTGNERKVSITGEAYFEVTHDPAKPFLVSKGDISVQVLGTRFNVNTYDDEEDIRVTLLEGSVKIKQQHEELVIVPGEQAIVKGGQIIRKTNEISLDAVMAWKNGYFAFSQSDLPAIMRQVARWYDVEVQFAGTVPDRKFGGKISRMASVSGVLKVLEESQVSFKVEGRKIIVLK